MLIDRYLRREILKPLAAICSLLVVIFAGYSATRFLADAANGLLAGKTATILVLLKVVIALEVLLPITLYFSVVVTLGRMHANSEIIAMEAAGIGEKRIRSTVFRLSLILALLVAGLSLYVRPWAYEKSYWLKAKAKAEVDLSRLEAGRFYEISEKKYALFMERVDHNRNRAKGVFIQREKGGVQQITYAREGWQGVDGSSGSKNLVLLDGYHYELEGGGKRDRIIRFETYQLPLEPKEIISLEVRRKATPTFDLAHSEKPGDIAEFQWRLSTGFSTVLLGLLGIPLSRTAPRRGKSAKLFSAVIIFAVYYNITALAKTWVEQGLVGSFPGVWWAPMLLAVLVAVLIRHPGQAPGGAR